MDTVCEAQRRDGQPCTTKALPGDTYCFAHSPKLRNRRRAGNAAGGRAKRTEHRAEKLMPEVLRPVLYRLLHGMAEVDAGRMDPRVATALASLASATVKVYEVASLEQRLLALEEQNARVG